MATRAELQRALAAEFERQDWPYEHDVAPALLDEIERSGATDGHALAGRVSADFLDRHGIARQQMALVLDRTLGGKTVERERSVVTSLVINDNRHAIQIGDHAQVTASALNAGGNQLVIQANTSKHDVLAAVSALVRDGLACEWNAEAARDLNKVIDARADVTIEDVREIATEAARVEQPESGRVKALVTKISTGAISGALGTGIVAALGALF